MMRTLRRDDLVCRQVVELVSDYLEGALSRRDRKRFERHLAACPNCTAYLEQMRVTIAATGRLTPEDLTAEARDEFTQLFRTWTTGEGGGHDDGPGGDTAGGGGAA
jgi:anti-sigma factor RsiW